MGKLAERYCDATRSGVYRVREASVPRSAALEAGIHLFEVTAASLSNGGCEALDKAIANHTAPGLVVLIDGTPPDEALLKALQFRAREAKESGQSFFAVFIDPQQRLALPKLYKERE